jgi:steroid 5-alpha reductase family enzyme
MSHKSKAILEITVYYLLIGLTGWLVFRSLPQEEAIFRFLYADLAMTGVTFFFSLLRKNSSVYDAYWSLIPFFFLLGWYFYYSGDNWAWPQGVAAAVVSFWSWRLTLNWAFGWPGWHHEDWRYVNFRLQFGKFFQPINFLAIHLYPSLIVFLSMLGLFWVFHFGELTSNLLFIAGAILSVVGTLFELVSDFELSKFKNRPNKKPSDLLRSGLWAYSRNPNYLGEILFWFGLMGMGFGFGAPWYTAIGPMGMLAMFLFASIPMKEKRMLKNRPEAFLKYKKEVSSLIPLPPKS